MSGPSLRLGSRRVGPGEPCLIVAEISGNHGQDYDRAASLVRAAVASGADAVKIQTYTPDTMTIDSDGEWFRVGGPENPESWKGETLYGLYGKACTPWEWHPHLKKIVEEAGAIFFSTPFDRSAVEFLESQDVPGYKIASYEITDLPLLRVVARTGKPIIVSVGMADESDIELALATLRASGASEIALLHCLTAYSPDPSAHTGALETIRDLAERHGVVAGFSDNNAGIRLPVLAVAMGASIVEKHFILRRDQGGPDADFSIDPVEFRTMVEEIRFAEAAVRGIRYGAAPGAEEYNRRFRRSLFVVRRVRRGERFTEANVRCIRPAFGLHPRHLDEVLGRTAAVDIEAGTPFSLDLILDTDDAG